MTNHFTNLGFDVVEVSDLTDLLVQGAKSADEFPLESEGSLLRWAVGAGIEMWIQVHPSGELVGVHPFFLGPTRVNFLVTRLDIQAEDANDGSLMGWVSPEMASGGSAGAYPMRFDLPAYPLGLDKIEIGGACEIQVAAFADEIALFETEEEFEQAQDEETEFSVQSFVPIGLIPPDEEEGEEDGELFGEELLETDQDYQPVAEALFSGIISRCEKRFNPYTQNPFWWLQATTFGAEYDVVVDPALLERDPKPGDIMQGHFWMAARITE